MSGIGYGSDTSCGSGGYRSGVLVRGRVLLSQAIERRLTTPRGTLGSTEEEAAYGIDMAGFIGAVGGEVAERVLPSRVRAELKKDDRIASVDVNVTREARADEELFLVEIDVTPADGSDPFALTLRVDQVEAKLLIGDGSGGISNG